jgi:hypothetical protein
MCVCCIANYHLRTAYFIGSILLVVPLDRGIVRALKANSQCRLATANLVMNPGYDVARKLKPVHRAGTHSERPSVLPNGIPYETGTAGSAPPSAFPDTDY